MTMQEDSEAEAMKAVADDEEGTTLTHQGQAQLHMLTTIDNPFNPFTDYDRWNAYDEAQGYYTSSFLARIVISSSELSEADQDAAIEFAIDEIVRENVLGIYRKVAIPSS